MYFAALLLGGLIGIAQCAVLSGLLPDFLPNSGAAGWLLLIIPFGAFCGVLFTRVLVFFVDSKCKPRIAAPMGLAALCGLPVALIAPMMLVGLGPNYQDYRYIAYFVEYGFAWSALFFLVYVEAKKSKT